VVTEVTSGEAFLKAETEKTVPEIEPPARLLKFDCGHSFFNQYWGSGGDGKKGHVGEREVR